MLSIKQIRDNIKAVEDAIKYKNYSINLNSIIKLDNKRIELLQTVESLKHKRNVCSKEIGKNLKDKIDSKELIKSMKILSDEIKIYDNDVNKIVAKINNELLFIPNIFHDSVPKGQDSSENVVIKEYGEKPKFKFKPQSHLDLSGKLNILDFKRASKISGTGFPLYVNKGAKLERNLINFMINHHVENNGYIEMSTPFIVSQNSMIITGQLPKFQEDMYFINEDDLYCIPTAEVPLTNIHKSEVLDAKYLPIQYVAYSPCFRREAGSYGKDTRGLLRVHQFNKVELVKFVHPRESYNELEKLVDDAKSILDKLNLHYRVIELCSGDLSFSAAKCFDIEVWSPFENKFLEVSSCSNFESFQARRGNIKFRNESGKPDFIHTLNGSGLATPRLMVALLETYQTKDGTIEFPKSLNKYIGNNIT